MRVVSLLSLPLLSTQTYKTKYYKIMTSIPAFDPFVFHYHLGNYQIVIDELLKSSVKSAGEKALRDALLYRCYIAQNKAAVVLVEVGPEEKTPHLKAVRMLAEYKLEPEGSKRREEIVATCLACLVDSELQLSFKGNPMAHLLLATILVDAGKLEEALRHLDSIRGYTSQFPGESVDEITAMEVHILLAMDRVDLAVGKVKNLEEAECGPVLQLAFAWVYMSFGKEKLKDAFYVYQNLIDRYGPTPYLLTGLATTLIGQGDLKEAAKVIKEALDLDPNYPEALANRLLLSDLTLVGPSLSFKKQMTQLRAVHPNHTMVEEYGSLSDKLDAAFRACRGGESSA